MEWKKDNAKYSCGELLFLGKWNVGGAHYNGCRSKGDPLMYIATCKLPGIKSNLGSYETINEAKAKAEIAVNHWLRNIPARD